MSRRNPPALLAAFSALMPAPPLMAQPAHRVKDLPPGWDTTWPYGLTASGGRLVFVADDGPHGPELWTRDGPSAGTSMFQDDAAASPEGLPLRGVTPFAGTDPRAGTGLRSMGGRAARLLRGRGGRHSLDGPVDRRERHGDRRDVGRPAASRRHRHRPTGFDRPLLRGRAPARERRDDRAREGRRDHGPVGSDLPARFPVRPIPTRARRTRSPRARSPSARVRCGRETASRCRQPASRSSAVPGPPRSRRERTSPSRRRRRCGLRRGAGSAAGA